MRAKGVRLIAFVIWLVVLNTAVSPAFTPIRAELPTNARGFSRGLLNFVVLPAGTPFPRGSRWLLLVTIAVGISLVFAATRTRQRRRAAGALEAVALALFVAVLLAPKVTPYAIVLTWRTFVLLTALLFSAPLIQGFSDAYAWFTPRASLAVATVALLGATFFGAAVLEQARAYDWNYSGFLHVSRAVSDAAPMLQERPDVKASLLVSPTGYDGQFMYLMAFDPFLRRFKDRPAAYRAFIDLPPYRYSRIGFSLLVDGVTLGRPEYFPLAMVWLIVLAHACLAGGLAYLAVLHGHSPWLALAYLAIPSFMPSLLSALPEAIAAGAIVVGLALWLRRRDGAAALLFAAGLLVRETSIVLVAAILLNDVGHDWRRVLRAAILALFPFVAWRTFVAIRLYSDFGWQAVVPSPGDLGAPFAGLARVWHHAVTHLHTPGEARGALIFPWIVCAAVGVCAWTAIVDPGPIQIAGLIYGLIVVMLEYGHVWSDLSSGERATYELFLCLLLMLLGLGSERRGIRRAVGTIFVVLALYTLAIAPDASASRAGLLLIR